MGIIIIDDDTLWVVVRIDSRPSLIMLTAMRESEFDSINPDVGYTGFASSLQDDGQTSVDAPDRAPLASRLLIHR